MDDPVETVEPANLRLLRRLVTVLTVVMIAGVIVVIGLLVTRLSASGPELPEEIALPGGARAQAVTLGDGWIGVVTTDDRFLVFDRLSGQLRQTVDIVTGAPAD
jgi:hypothetical protein